eukprot:6460086-Amphidinium_carterae.2
MSSLVDADVVEDVDGLEGPYARTRDAPFDVDVDVDVEGVAEGLRRHPQRVAAWALTVAVFIGALARAAEACVGKPHKWRREDSMYIVPPPPSNGVVPIDG